MPQLIFVTSVKTVPVEHDGRAFENMRNEHYPGKEDGHDLVRYLLNTSRTRRPQRAVSRLSSLRYWPSLTLHLEAGFNISSFPLHDLERLERRTIERDLARLSRE